MKKPLELAAELFQSNEHLIEGHDSEQEKANLYKGLSLLAQGLQALEKRVEQLESAGSTERSRSYPQRRFRTRIFLAHP